MILFPPQSALPIPSAVSLNHQKSRCLPSHRLCLPWRLLWRAFWWLCHHRILSAARASHQTYRRLQICLLLPCSASKPLEYRLPTRSSPPPTVAFAALFIQNLPRGMSKPSNAAPRKDFILWRHCFGVFWFCWRQINKYWLSIFDNQHPMINSPIGQSSRPSTYLPLHSVYSM